MTMFVAKKGGRPYKNQVSMVAFSPSRSSFQSRDKEFLTPLRAFNKLADLLNLGPSLALFQILKYTKNDLQ